MNLNLKQVDAHIKVYAAGHPHSVVWMADMLSSDLNGMDEGETRRFANFVGDGPRCAELMQLLLIKEISRRDPALAEDLLPLMDQLALHPGYRTGELEKSS